MSQRNTYSQRLIKNNFNRLVAYLKQTKTSLTKEEQDGLEMLNETGNCAGLTYAWLFYTADDNENNENRISEFFEYLNFLILLPETEKIGKFYERWENRHPQFELHLLNFISIVQKGQKKQDSGIPTLTETQWDKTTSFLCTRFTLANYLKLAGVGKTHTRMCIGLYHDKDLHLFGIRFDGQSYYLFEPNEIDINSIEKSFSDIDSLAAEIVTQYAETYGVTFLYNLNLCIRFFSKKNNLSLFEKQIIKLKNLSSLPEVIKDEVNHIIQLYETGRISQVDASLFLLDTLGKVEVDNDTNKIKLKLNKVLTNNHVNKDSPFVSKKFGDISQQVISFSIFYNQYISKILIQNADSNRIEKNLILALHHGNTHAFKFFLKSMKPERIFVNELLHQALYYNYTDIAAFLIKSYSGKDFILTKKQYEELFRFVIWYGNFKLLELLYNHFADPTKLAIHPLLTKCLTYAVKYNKLEMLKWLIEKGTDICYVQENLLAIASVNQYTDIVKFLLNQSLTTDYKIFALEQAYIHGGATVTKLILENLKDQSRTHYKGKEKDKEKERDKGKDKDTGKDKDKEKDKEKGKDKDNNQKIDKILDDRILFPILTEYYDLDDAMMVNFILTEFNINLTNTPFEALSQYANHTINQMRELENLYQLDNIDKDIGIIQFQIQSLEKNLQATIQYGTTAQLIEIRKFYQKTRQFFNRSDVPKQLTLSLETMDKTIETIDKILELRKNLQIHLRKINNAISNEKFELLIENLFSFETYIKNPDAFPKDVYFPKIQVSNKVLLLAIIKALEKIEWPYLANIKEVLIIFNNLTLKETNKISDIDENDIFQRIKKSTIKHLLTKTPIEDINSFEKLKLIAPTDHQNFIDEFNRYLVMNAGDVYAAQIALAKKNDPSFDPEKNGEVAYHMLLIIKDSILRTKWDIKWIDQVKIFDTNKNLINVITPTMKHMLQIINEGLTNNINKTDKVWNSKLKSVFKAGKKAVNNPFSFYEVGKRALHTQYFHEDFYKGNKNLKQMRKARYK